jgi:hypothetical protein
MGIKDAPRGLDRMATGARDLGCCSAGLCHAYHAVLRKSRTWTSQRECETAGYSRESGPVSPFYHVPSGVKPRETSFTIAQSFGDDNPDR